MQDKMPDNKKKKSSDNDRTITIILAVVIALLLWSYVIIQVNPTKEETISKIPVQLLNVQSLTARQLAIAGDGEYMVDVVVEGRRADIIKVKNEEIVAEADLFGWSKGENYIPVNVKVPSALKIVEVRSAKIQVTIEDLVAVSKPVIVSFRGDFRKDTEEGDIELRPENIEVTGAKSAVEAVDEVRVYVDVEDLTSMGSEIQCEPVPLNTAEMIVDNVRLSSGYVYVAAKLLQIKEVPLVVETVGSPGDGLGVEISKPETILIKGTKTALMDVENIKTEPIDMAKSKNGNVALSLVLPDGIELSNKNPRIAATINIEETAGKQFTFDADEILMEGLTKGKSVNTDVTSIVVSIVGRKNIVDQLQQNQIQPYIDVEDLPLGSQTVPILISSSIPLHSATADPSHITITITETEQESTVE